MSTDENESSTALTDGQSGTVTFTDTQQVAEIQLTDPPTWKQIMEVVKVVNGRSGTTKFLWPTDQAIDKDA